MKKRSRWQVRGLTACLLGIWLLAGHAQVKPIVILVSLDAWRWDYMDRAAAPNLKALAARGVRSEGLIPSFPTVTFPNHYTIVTGLVPDRHGIVSNNMADRSIGPQRFTMSAATSRAPQWWGGEPLWATAGRQGLKTASMFWPGSEAIHPTYWKPYDGKVPNEDRVKQVVDWLGLPEADRPSFITLYFSDVDTAAHDSGPESPAAFAAAARLDDMMGRLVDGVAKAGVADRTTIVAVSDHGQAATSPDRVVFLDDYVTREQVEVIDSGAFLSLNPAGNATVDSLYQRLAGRHPALSVYRKASVPAWLQYGSHPRVPALVGVVERGWVVIWRDSFERSRKEGRFSSGAHGYDPRFRDMQGLFVAAGPRLRRGYVAPPFQNVHVYQLLCDLLGIRPAPNDGDAAQTATFLQW